MPKPLHKNLTAQVLTAILLGAAIGHLKPAWGVSLKPLGDGFIRLIKMVVAPIIFLTIVSGIASMGDLKKVGRVGFKALLYFEIVTTFALAIGLLVGNLFQPGAGFRASAPTTQSADVQQYAQQAQHQTITDFALHILPDNIAASFAGNDLLPVLFISVLTGIAVSTLRTDESQPVIRALDLATRVMFRIVALVMILAPFGALGAMAFTVGKFGLHALLPLAKLMACVYLTLILFIFVILGSLCRAAGLSLWRFLVFIREELLLVLGTSSSESAVPRLIEKLELLGCSRGVVGMVVPAGYSFNLDGTSIYLSMAVLFIAQAYGIHLSLPEQLKIMAILILTSKGAAGVAGAGFVCLAATISTTHLIPLEGLALLLGVDRFMSEARALTNLIGNGVATLLISRAEREFNPLKYHDAIRSPELQSDLLRPSPTTPQT
jgi:aerobic C4-dicarboxylate transport protein